MRGSSAAWNHKFNLIGVSLTKPRFTLSFRDVEEMVAERGLDVSYETIRRWFLKFGSAIAANLRRTRPKPSDGTVRAKF